MSPPKRHAPTPSRPRIPHLPIYLRARITKFIPAFFPQTIHQRSYSIASQRLFGCIVDPSNYTPTIHQREERPRPALRLLPRPTSAFFARITQFILPRNAEKPSTAYAKWLHNNGLAVNGWSNKPFTNPPQPFTQAPDALSKVTAGPKPFGTADLYRNIRLCQPCRST